ncbi:MAG TPA: hypothetical protein VGD76_19195 [Ramlibacter sp.]
MKRSRTALVTVAFLAALAVLALSFYLRSWGGVALLALVGGGYAWYRAQVARGEAAEQFFGDLGEDTRLTTFQAGSPSELPLDRTIPPRGPREPPKH